MIGPDEASHEACAPGKTQQEGTVMYRIQMLSLETLINLVAKEDWSSASEKGRRDHIVTLSRFQIVRNRSLACNGVAAATDEVLQNV